MIITQTMFHFLIHFVNLYSDVLLPHISTLSCVAPHSRTLIDNIVSNNIEGGLTSRNIISTISDHYAQFFLMKNMKTKQKNTKNKKQKYTAMILKISMKPNLNQNYAK